ncbi:MAG: VanZ family protein [Acetivibrionales bacterium]|jgi:VanZ family protein
MKRTISWALVLLWMALIFFLSSQPADQSNELSTGITEAIARTIEKIIPGTEIIIGELNHVVRKNAHFFAYMVLGILTMNALRSSGADRKKAFLLAMVICVIYAASDEIHQLFVPGRGCQFTDVLIDSAGALVGSGIVCAAGAIRRKRQASE